MTRKRRSSWGCAQKVRPGVYRLRYMADGERRSETVYGTRREADDRLAELRVKHGSGPSKKPVTVGEAYEKYYWPHVETAAVSSTRTNTASLWRAHVGPRWSGVPLRDVRPGDFQEWLLTLTRSQAVSSLRVMRGILKRAVMHGLLELFPLNVSFEMPDRVDRPRPRTVIREADMEAYYAAAESCGLGATFVLAACCGLRVGESLGPMVGEVMRMEDGGVTVAAVPVTRQIDASGKVATKAGPGGGEVERLKTRKSERWAAVGGVWAERLLALQDEARARGDVWLTDDGLGNPVPQWDARGRWAGALKAAGLPRILLKNLRPTFATVMDAHDVPVEQVARLMGHTKPDITFDVYQRPGLERAVQIAANAARHKDG